MISHDPQILKEVNDLGEQLTRMLEGRRDLVLINVMAAMFAGAMKSAGYSQADAEECLDFVWRDGGGLEAKVGLPE